MGGPGSGRRWHDNPKDTTDELRAIDVRYWKREGVLEPGLRFTHRWRRRGRPDASVQAEVQADRVILTYRHRQGGEFWHHTTYPVYLAWRPCHFGGQRPWFLCPDCGRRVALLYGGERFLCRHCHDLVYPCQNETDLDRASRRADKVRERLGWDPGVLNGPSWKPKGMHWKSYAKLKADYDRRADEVLNGIAKKLRLDRP